MIILYCVSALLGAWNAVRLIRELRPRVAPEYQAPRADLPTARVVRR